MVVISRSPALACFARNCPVYLKSKRFNPLTGSRSGSFDELFVRGPPAFGPFLPVFAWWTPPCVLPSALESDLATGLAAKRDVVDSFSATEVTAFLGGQASLSALDTKADSVTHFTRTQTHAIFQSVSDSVAALALKRDASDSHSVAEIATLLSGKANEAATQSHCLTSRIRLEACQLHRLLPCTKR